MTNERTKGRVTVLKYDTESETENPQGDAVLDGAVYELRAAATSFMQMGILAPFTGKEIWSEPERWATFRADLSFMIWNWAPIC